MVDLSRRDFLKGTLATGAAVVTTGSTVGCTTKKAAPPEPEAPAKDASEPVYDMRKDALLFKRPAKDELTKGIEFEIEKLPAGKVVKLDLAAEQAYQLATICNTVDVGGKKETHLQAIVLPKQDGKMKVLQLNEGQEVQLRLFMGKDSKEPAVVTGGPVAANLVQGKVVNWMKPILNELDKPATKGAKNDLAAPNYNFKLVDAYLDAKAKGKLPAELKNTAVYLDGAIEQALAAQVKK